MKRFFFVFSALLMTAAFATYCGGGGGSSKEPAESTFENPDGGLDDNAEATSAMNEALSAASSGQLNSFAVEGLTKRGIERALQALKKDKRVPVKIRAQSFADIEACVDSNDDGTDVTLDMGCLSDAGLLEGCTGSGTIRIQTNADFTEFTITFNNFGMDCADEDVSVSACTGEIRSTTLDNGTEIFCVDLTCTVDGETETTEGCVRSDGVVAVDLDDGTVLCLSVVANSGCTKICSEWEDATGEMTIICDVIGTCSSVTDVEEVENCEVDRTVTDCPTDF